MGSCITVPIWISGQFGQLTSKASQTMVSKRKCTQGFVNGKEMLPDQNLDISLKIKEYERFVPVERGTFLQSSAVRTLKMGHNYAMTMLAIFLLKIETQGEFEQLLSFLLSSDGNKVDKMTVISRKK